MKKLELKHIAHYLPFKLKVKVTNRHKNEIMEVNSRYGNYVPIENLIDIPEEFKIILRPLTDLDLETKKNLENIYFDKHGNKLENLFFYYGNVTNLQDIFEVYEWLFKNHFDVFGLIEKGLAIDINTLSGEAS